MILLDISTKAQVMDVCLHPSQAGNQFCPVLVRPCIFDVQLGSLCG